MKGIKTEAGIEKQITFDKLVVELPKVLSSATVSYTHLRAHETVLDLVCRLLLEKKTNYRL